jgi:hypothetical protein
MNTTLMNELKTQHEVYLLNEYAEHLWVNGLKFDEYYFNDFATDLIYYMIETKQIIILE